MARREISFTALGIALLSSLALAAPAAADTTRAEALTTSNSCGIDHICMYEDPGYQGSEYIAMYATSPSNSGSLVDIGGWDGDNEISSVANRTGFHIWMYDNDNGTGYMGCVSPGQWIPELWRDNEMESFRFADSCR
ncbi:MULTISPECIES: peptidase inhibitor family I36 protein [Nocardiopsis]|uniref:Peptidase inhibitor family I36 n=1 Tax=Nocardiopsis sinuspersici TaxID=501010 RepID=A0A1V3BZY9_9ACTN|nr:MULTISPECIES: peptidase inhibitor family I36 protein [Nocardiopsis]OOC53963.1 hypothetical protein NOSIN_09225 [Nocardiopsis sinuspersici]